MKKNTTHKLVGNTLITYAKIVITALLALYSTRIVLEALGAADFGLYSVVGGLVATLSFLNAVMTTSTQRYLSVSLGKGDSFETKSIFANSIALHFIIGFFVLLIVELVGIYFIKNQLNIELDKVEDAIYLLHFVAFSTFFTILSVPYNALIISHENMMFIAIVTVIDSILKLIIAFAVSYSDSNRLILYGFLIMLTTVFSIIIKRFYSKLKYDESIGGIRSHFNPKVLKKIGSFAGWQLFGSLSAIARNQGVAVLLNLFFTTTVNAAYGIASQVNNQLMFITQSLLSAIRPQIMKSEGAGERDRMIMLSLIANKFAYYFFAIIAIPFYFLMPIILSFWLENVPEYTISFCRAIIVLTLVSQLSQGVITAVQAIGRIRVYQIVAGGTLLLTVPIGYFLLRSGYSAVSIIYIGVILEFIVAIFRMFYFNYLTGYSCWVYFENVFLRILISSIPAVIVCFFISETINSDLLKIFSVTFSSSIILIICIYFIGLNVKERSRLNYYFSKVRSKLQHNISRTSRFVSEK